jgi:hypothetical protein
VKEGPPEENPWGIRFMRMFDMSNDSHLFLTEPGEDCVPLYEAKMMHHFNHRFGDYAMRPEGSQDSELPRIPGSRLDDPNYSVTPRYWVRRADLPDLGGRQWLLGFRDITNATNERTAIFSVLPPVAANHKTPLIFPREPVAAFVGNVNSLTFDYVARQNVGGTSLGFFILKQLAVLLPSEYDPAALKFVTYRVLELTYTAWDLAGFAKHLNYVGPPFRWNEDRRFQLRSELDALYFHLYGLNREDTDYILDTFPIVRRNEEKKYGEYRTKRTVLEIYDRMAANDFASPLDPPAADIRAAHSLQSVALPDLRLVASGAWASPPDVSQDNMALLTLFEVLRAFAIPTDPQLVRQAAILVRKPALAAAFMTDADAVEWLRAIGAEARPLPDNVVNIGAWRREITDHAWGAAVRRLGQGAGPWQLPPEHAAPTGQEWVAGRASVAVRLASTISAQEAEYRMDRFLRSIEDAQTSRAVS